MTAPTTTTSTTQPTPDDINREIDSLRSELARSDSKASLLLALTGGSLVAIISTASNAHLPLPAISAGIAAALALFTATVTLLLVALPRLSGPGWPTWPGLTLPDLADRVASGRQIAEVQALATIALKKFTYIQVAVVSALAGLGLLVLAGILTITT
jgi:hypothetical protein